MSAGPRGPYRARHAPLVRLDAPPPQPGLAGRGAAVRRDVPRRDRDRHRLRLRHGHRAARRRGGRAAGAVPAVARVGRRPRLAHRAGQLRARHARPGRRPADRHGHPRRPRRRGPARPPGRDRRPRRDAGRPGSPGFAYIPSPWEGFFYLLVTGAAWGVGTLVRQMQERSRELQVLAARLAAQQEAVAASAVVAERSRIAREVHDSVAHSVSVMVLQMGGLRRLLPDKPEAQEVLLGLERLGREAVDEMRRVVGILREGAGGERCRPGAPALAVAAGRRPRRAARRWDADRAHGDRRSGRAAPARRRLRRPRRPGGAVQRRPARRWRRHHGSSWPTPPTG